MRNDRVTRINTLYACLLGLLRMYAYIYVCMYMCECVCFIRR